MRPRNLYSAGDSDTDYCSTDTEYEFDDVGTSTVVACTGGTSTSSASKNDIKIRKKFVRDQRKKQTKKRESVSTDSSRREPEQMRDIQREAPVSPILPCKRPSKSTSPVTPDLHTDDGLPPVKKPCYRRISMTPISSIEKDCGESSTTQFSDDVLIVNNELVEFETLSSLTPLEIGAEEEISEINKESALSPVLPRRNAHENTPEVIQNPESETGPCGLVASPVLKKGHKASSNLDHTKVKRFTGKPRCIEVPRRSPASEDTQTTTNHVSTQTEPPAAPGSTLPYAITLVFSTSRVIPCKLIVSSAHPDILD